VSSYGTRARLSDSELSRNRQSVVKLCGAALTSAPRQPGSWGVVKTLAGSGVHNDDPDMVRRCRPLARHIGASVEMIEEEAGHTRVFFRPPARQ
jgi:hypothetical protein